MRNSSDIFCLKEPKIGENDGSLIFSVNGSSFSKINRRHHLSSDVFQFGQPGPAQTSPNCETPEPAEVAKVDPQPLEEVVEGKEPVESAVEKGAGEPVASGSSMPRNPLTGDGVEEDQKQSCKKRSVKKSGKWLW